MQLPENWKDCAYDMLCELAGLDTHDVDLRDNPEAYKAAEKFLKAVTAQVSEIRPDPNPAPVAAAPLPDIEDSFWGSPDA